MHRRATLVTALTGLLVAGCASSGPEIGPRVSASAPVTASPSSVLASPAASAGDRLARLAATSTKTSFAGRYGLRTGDGTTADVVAVHLTDGYRVDITADAATDSLIGTPTGTVSCHAEAASTACFQAAGPGQPLPDLFDAGVQHVFTDYLATLATSVAQYQVDDTVPKVGPPAAPSADCFSVEPLDGASEPAVPSGNYCLAQSGLPTLVTYGAASLTLQQVLPAPAASALVPPASPQPLPSP